MTARIGHLSLLLLFSSCHAAPPPASAAAPLPSKWISLRDSQHRFRLDYPPGWAVDTEVTPVAHYSMVFAALNSSGIPGLVVHELPTSPTSLELNPAIIARQVPAGTAYIDFDWQEGPGPVDEPPGAEMVGDDLTAAKTDTPAAKTTDGIEGHSLHFWKFGKLWRVTVYLHLPVDVKVRDDVERVLASFRLE
jgi:hypothetical protein